METLASALLAFLGSAMAIVLAGIGLARFGDELADKTGWGKLWIGTMLVATATGLPEVSVNVSAVWLQNAPELALGNVFGANMVNVAMLAMVAFVFGVTKLFGTRGRDIPILISLSILLVALAVVMGASGDLGIGPTSLGGLLIVALYIGGMRKVYRAGRTDMDLRDIRGPAGRVRDAWIGFGLSVLVVLFGGRYLAASADRIAELWGISASFVGVALASVVTTLPEASVTVSAALRKSYGIAMGNVYGSNAFNVAIFALSDLFHDGPLLGEMDGAHFAAAGGALLVMAMGFALWKACRSKALGAARLLAPAIPLVWFAALYLVFRLARG